MENSNNYDSAEVLSKLLTFPGIKVNRQKSLADIFKDQPTSMLTTILEAGPVKAGLDRDLLRRKAMQLLAKRRLESSAFSFLAGLPGGVVGIGVGLTADTVQYFAFALRLAQEIAYIYGVEDFWDDGVVDDEAVQSRLLLYLGVMFGISGASAALHLVSASLAKQAMKKLPQKALTKTFYYPIVKSIAKALGKQMTKGIFAKGVAKAIPVAGGIFSGGITYATMKPMGLRLINSLDESLFDYTEEEIEADIIEVEAIVRDAEEDEDSLSKTEVNHGDQLHKAVDLYMAGIITNEEFETIKKRVMQQATEGE